MPANTNPIFPITCDAGHIKMTAANTGLDGTGTVYTAFTAGSNGSRIEYVHFHAGGTTTAGMLRIFLYDGSNYFLLTEIPTAAVTPSGTVAAAEYEWVPTRPLCIPTGYTLVTTTNNAETWYVLAQGGDF